MHFLSISADFIQKIRHKSISSRNQEEIGKIDGEIMLIRQVIIIIYLASGKASKNYYKDVEFL